MGKQHSTKNIILIFRKVTENIIGESEVKNRNISFPYMQAILKITLIIIGEYD